MCTNSNVPNKDSPAFDGIVFVTRGTDGNTTAKVAMTASSNTTYNFYLKCVRQLGVIKTDDEGAGRESFTFPTNFHRRRLRLRHGSGRRASRKQVPERDRKL
jgi:hypothetical protein